MLSPKWLLLSQIASLSKNWLYNLDQIWAQKLNSKLQSYDQTWALNTWPKFSFKIVDLTSALESWPKFCIKILTELPLQNLDQISASKSWPKTYFSLDTCFSINIVTKIEVQNPYQTSAPKSWPNCCQHVPHHQQLNIRNTNNLKKFWIGIFKGKSHISEVY